MVINFYPDAPTDVVVTDNNIYVHVLNSVYHTITTYSRTLLGNQRKVNVASGLPGFAKGSEASR